MYKNPLALGKQVNFVVKAESQGITCFLELSEPVLADGTYVVFGRHRIRFTSMTAILFFIFMNMVYTKIVMILALLGRIHGRGINDDLSRHK